MSFDFRLPSITGSDTEKIAQLTRYIYRLTEQLNFSMNTIEGAVHATGVTGSATSAPSVTQSEEEKLEGAYASIKSMIIKSADFIESLTDKISVELGGSYLANSVFGTYKEETKATLEANSTGITQLYSYTSNLRSDYADRDVENKSYIKTGLLYYDGSQPVYGVGVGLLNATTDAGGHRLIDRRNLATTFTADRISFWGNDKELAHITPQKIYFPDGTLEAHDANITGNITAREGEIGGCLIEDGVLKITDANIDGKLTASHIDVDTLGVATIISGTVTTDYINTLDVTAASLEVPGKFYANKTDDSVRIGGFIVEDDNIHSSSGIRGTYKGTTTGGGMVSSAKGYMFTYFLSDGSGIVYRLFSSNNTNVNYLYEFRSYDIATSSGGGEIAI